MPGKKSAIYGEVMTVGGDGRPLEVIKPGSLASMDKAGYAPERIDGLIETLIQNAEAGAGLLNTYTSLLGGLMEKVQVHLVALVSKMPNPEDEYPAVTATEVVESGITGDLAVLLEMVNRVSLTLERLNKMTKNAIESKDAASRLRVFLATGDEERDTLATLGEMALRQMVVNAANGWNKPPDDSDA